MNPLFETIFLYYFIGINIVAFCLYGYDKWMAQINTWRVPESMLWIVALIGGSVGALAGMQFFRHKTQKISFQFVLMLIVTFQVSLAIVAGYLLGFL